MLAVPADLGLQGAVLKRMSEQKSPSQVLSTAAVMLGTSLIFVSICAYLLRGVINQYIGAKLTFFLIIVVILNQVSNLINNVIKGELRVGETASLNLLKQVTFNIVGIVLISADTGISGLIYSLIIGSCVVIVWGTYKKDTAMGHPSLDVAKSLFEFSKFSVISYIDSYLYSWLDVVIIGLLLTQSEVGAYEVAWRVTGPVLLLGGAVATVILPQISKWDVEGSHEKIDNTIHDSVFISLFLVLPAFIGGIILSQEILYYVFNPEYATAWLVLIILLAGRIVEAFNLIYKNALSGVDRPDLRAVAVVIGMIMNLVLNFGLVSWVGMVGAAIATTISITVSTLITTYYLYSLINFRLPYYDLLLCLVSASVMGLIIYIVRQYISVDSLWVVVALVLTGATIYIGTTLLFPSVRDRIKMVLQQAGI
jgi:O-antigen/teichoic acid export membrane protein